MQMLIFEIDGYKYAVVNQHIDSVVRRQAIQPIPNLPPKVAGIMHVRDSVYTVIDLYNLLFSKRATYSTEQIFILTDNNTSYIVDRVVSVCELSDNDILPAGSLVNFGGLHIVEGFFKQGDEIITLLDFSTIDNID